MISTIPQIPRIDFTFSYWIFAWFLLYYFDFTNYNPKFGLSIALFFNTIRLFTTIYYKNSFIYIFLFVVINTFLKIIPLWILKNDSIKKTDILATLYLFGIYNIWLLLNNTNIIELMKDSMNAIKSNHPNTPFIYYIDKYILQK